MLATIGTIFSAAAGGGIFGIVGGLIQKALDMWNHKQQLETDLAILRERNAHELLMRDKDLAMIESEAKNATALAEINRSKEVDVAAYGAMAASHEADRATYATAERARGSRWFIAVDVVRGFTRPALTIYLTLALTAFSAWVTWEVIRLAPELLKAPEFLKDAFTQLIYALIFMSTTAVMWWFAARGVQPRAEK